MSERNCALQSKAYLALKEVYEDREKVVREWKKSGRKAVMTLGDDVPDEIIIAAGMLPIRVSGIYGEQPESDKYLEMSFGPVWRSIFEKIVSGAGAELYDYIAIARSSDMLIRIYYYLRELKRFEPERPIAPIKFIDYDFISRNLDAQYHNEDITKMFIETVEGWTCSKLKDEQLMRAAKICNDNRDALAAFSALRYGEDCRVTGTEALTVIGASLFMEKEKSTALIRELTEEAKLWPKVEGVKVYFSGSVQNDLEVYELIEELGGNVVSEDHEWGDRHFDRNIELEYSPVAGITDRYMYRMPSSEQSFVKPRCKALVEAVEKSGAQVVLVYMNFNDESYLMDYPTEKKMFDERGIPSVSITRQRVPMINKEQMKETIGKLIESAKGGN